jgi:hypothetical protein
MQHPSTPANPALLVSGAMNLKQQYSDARLAAMQQERQAQGLEPDKTLALARYFAQVYKVK